MAESDRLYFAGLVGLTVAGATLGGIIGYNENESMLDALAGVALGGLYGLAFYASLDSYVAFEKDERSKRK